MRSLQAFCVWILAACTVVMVTGQCSRRPPDEDVVDDSAVICQLTEDIGPLLPGPNRRICYRTCIDETGTCVPSIRLDQPLPFDEPNDGSNSYFITRVFSPNFLDSRQYRGSTICLYNIECPDPNQILHYVITDHSLEDEEQNLCVDFLRLDRSAYDTDTESCGGLSSIIDDRADFNENRLIVEFRSNRRDQGFGYFLVATCINTEFYDLQDCTEAQPAEVPTPPAVGRRRRRAAVEDSLEGAAPRNRTKRSFRTQWFKIRADSIVVYKDGVVTVQLIGEDRVLLELPGIRVMQVYNRPQGFLTFKGSASKPFRGCGKLQIGHGIVWFIQDGVDPRFRLSVDEEDIVQSLYKNLFLRAMFEDENFSVDDEDDTEPLQMRPQAGPTGIDFDQLAEDNAGACNGVLRAAAQIYRELILGT